MIALFAWYTYVTGQTFLISLWVRWKLSVFFVVVCIVLITQGVFRAWRRYYLGYGQLRSLGYTSRSCIRHLYGWSTIMSILYGVGSSSYEGRFHLHASYRDIATYKQGIHLALGPFLLHMLAVLFSLFCVIFSQSLFLSEALLAPSEFFNSVWYFFWYLHALLHMSHGLRTLLPLPWHEGRFLLPSLQSAFSLSLQRHWQSHTILLLWCRVLWVTAVIVWGVILLWLLYTDVYKVDDLALLYDMYIVVLSWVDLLYGILRHVFLW